MIAKRYWSAGIQLAYLHGLGEPAWSGRFRFHATQGKAEDFTVATLSELGELRVSAWARGRTSRDTVREVTDTLLERTEHLDVEFGDDPILFPDYGVSDWPPDWKQVLQDEAGHLGWDLPDLEEWQ